MHSAKYFRHHQTRFGATLDRENSQDKILWENQVYVHESEDGQQFIEPVPERSYLYESVGFALTSLRAHLDDSAISLHAHELSIDAALESTKANKRAPRKDVVLSDADQARLAANLDGLVNGL